MIGRSNSFLGVAVSDRTITCAEVAVSSGAGGASGGGAERGGGRVVRRTATFVFPAELSLDTAPDAAGQAFAAFLRTKRFTSSRVVVGIPARWLMAIEKELPPTNEQQMRAALRLQAERMAVSESGDVVFDYAGRASTLAGNMNRVLLVGVLRQRLDRITQMMDAAGMSVVAVTSTGLALASVAAGRSDNDVTMLVLGKGGGEMVFQHDGTPRMLRHVAMPAVNGHGVQSVTPIGSELRRAVALVPAAPNGDNSNRELLLLDGVGLSSDQVGELSTRLGWNVRSGDGFDVLRVQNTSAAAVETQPAGQFAPAVSLALAGAEPKLLPLDFRHSRLAPTPPRRISRNMAWGIALGLTAIVAIVALYLSVRQQQQRYDMLTSQIDRLAPQVKTAQITVDHATYSRGYFDTRPPMLDCLRQLSLTIHSDDRLWVTTFTLHDTGKGTLAGKSLDQKTVLGVIDRLKKNPNFNDVKLQDMREADQRSREQAFSISFNFNLAE